MKLRTAFAASAVALVLGLSIDANAATWDFTYTTLNGDTATGTLTTGNTPDSSVTFGSATALGGGNGGVYPGGTISPDSHGYDILSISGTRDGTPIAGTYNTGTVGTLESMPGYIFDNVVYTGSTSFDILGLEYQVGASNFFNVYYTTNGPNGLPEYVENNTPITNLSITQVSPVPLPPALPLFGAVIAGLGVFGWRKRVSVRAN
jgi:hypothetical protein